MVKILHFADAHIDMVRQGRRDPLSGLPLRSLDYLRALDTIVDTAIAEKVEMVIFAGDAYRDRTPAPTYQREWGKRILRLSQADIFTVMVVGNHDLSPAHGRAHALQEYETLHIPNTYVVSEPCLLGPQDLNGLPIQLIGIPWLTRSGMMAYFQTQGQSVDDINAFMEEMLSNLLHNWIAELDPALPAVLTSHVTVQGAQYGNERSVLLGRDLVISPGMLRNEHFDYVALGHIHKFQDLNQGSYPPIVYPGSIEKVDFGEINDEKGFIIAEIERGNTHYHFHKLHGRRYLSRTIEITNEEEVTESILPQLPPAAEIADSIFRLILTYPRRWEALIDEKIIRQAAQDAFEFYLIRRPHIERRVQLSEGRSLNQLRPMELLDLYWKSVHMPEDEVKALNALAGTIIHRTDSEESMDGLSFAGSTEEQG